MKIKRIEHVAIAVDDLDRTKALLSDLFGFDLAYEEVIGSTKLAMYPVGESHVELLEALDARSPVAEWIEAKGQSLFHLCFEVEDIDSALAELRAKGAELLDDSPRVGHGGARIAFVSPESTGNILVELAELPSTHAAEEGERP